MKRYRIGLTVGNKTSDYPHAVRMGIQNTIEEAGHILVAVCDLIPHHTITNGMAYYRMAFQIAARLDLDAIIIPVGSVIAHLSGDEEMALALLQPMNPAKTLVMEREVEGFRCVTKDNDPGMHECMRHLIETCGFTKIAFVSGPQSSRGAREREAIYFDEMAAHGLPTPSSLFARGSFRGDCHDVIRRILDENPDLEAIACACDLIAYTAYEVLYERGISVGEDIAVTGFDDHMRSAHLDPPLSTVHITGYDYGCMAAREALRLCAGQPQQEHVLASSFMARNSCGEDVRGDVERFRRLLRQTPFPLDELTSIMVDSTLYMAGPRIAHDFRMKMQAFLQKIIVSYRHHRRYPDDEVMLFSSADLSVLFQQEYAEHLSLEGFHSTAITLLDALAAESSDVDVAWTIGQISHLHLRIARMLSSSTQAKALVMQEREWTTFHVVDDTLRVDKDPTTAYRLMFEELMRLGVREADLFLLPEPVEFVGAGGVALSDKLNPIGTISNGFVCVEDDAAPVALQDLLDVVLQRYSRTTTVCTVGGLVAGNELVGIGLFDAGTLDNNGQLMAFLNLGFALKHLQMIADEREMNALLNSNNLLLEQQSQHDVLTGLLNRRGFLNRIGHLLIENIGREGAVLYLDLDGLKTINDTLGHDVGDKAICQTARILDTHIPKDGLVARLGGDEFVAFVLVNGDDDLTLLMRRIHQEMVAFNQLGLAAFVLSISSGSERFAIDEETPAQLADLMARADERLYEMKRHRKQSRRFVRGA